MRGWHLPILSPGSPNHEAAILADAQVGGVSWCENPFRRPSMLPKYKPIAAFSGQRPFPTDYRSAHHGSLDRVEDV